MDSCGKCYRIIEENQGYCMDQCCYQMICQSCIKLDQTENKIYKCQLCKKKINYEIPQQVKLILCKFHDQQICFKQNNNFYCEICIFETNENDKDLMQIDQEEIYDDLKLIRDFFKLVVLENNYKAVNDLLEKQVVYFEQIQKFIDKINVKYTIEGLKIFQVQQKKKKNHFDPLQKLNDYKKKDDQQNHMIQINQVYNYQKSKVVNKEKVKDKGKQSHQLREQGQQINKQKQYIQELKLNFDQQNDLIQQQLLEIENLRNQVSLKSNIQRNNQKIEICSQKQKSNQEKMKIQIEHQKELISVQQEKIEIQKKQLENLKNPKDNYQKFIIDKSEYNKINNQIIQLKQEKQILEEKVKRKNSSGYDISLPSVASKIISVFKKSESTNKLSINPSIQQQMNQSRMKNLSITPSNQQQMNTSRMNKSILKNSSRNTTARNKTKELNVFQKIYMKMKGQERPKSKVTIKEPYMNKLQNQTSRSIFGYNSLLGQSQIDKLKFWLNNSNLKLNLIYKGSRDGFTAKSFYDKCENKKQTIIIIKSEHDQLFGGYADIAWKKTNTLWVEGQGKSFVFSFNKNSKHQCKDKKYELSGNQYYFAKFGYDIAISDQCNENSKSYSNIGCKYQSPQGLAVNSDEAKQYFAGSYLFKVLEIETYQIQN